MVKAKWLIAALVPFLLVSCEEPDSSAHYPSTAKQLTERVSRVHDSELGITCWTFNNGGITCLRDSDDTRVAPTKPPKAVDNSWYEEHPFGVEEKVIEFPAVSDSKNIAGGPGA